MGNRAHHIGAAYGQSESAAWRVRELTGRHRRTTGRADPAADASAAMRGLSANGDLQKFTKIIGCEMPVAEAIIFVGL
jgi:hypothetical protein